uniref:Plasma membrane ascorbate-dependent reductase CYBRD1 n=1 Tax=Sphenodon punctatus TaxID=8508 RepID=A0A8D0L835_SPHPU
MLLRGGPGPPLQEDLWLLLGLLASVSLTRLSQVPGHAVTCVGMGRGGVGWGFAVFLLPFAPVSVRASLMPMHVYFGLLIFGTVIATALMGFTEKLIFALKDPQYSTLPPEGIFVKTLGLLVLIFGAFILWMATRPHWKRPPEQNSKIQYPSGGKPEGTEEESTMRDFSNTDKSDVEFNTEAARKRNFKLDEAGQRSTM